MNATAIRGTMLGLGLAGALCLVSGKVAAQDCDLATVAGSYGMNFDGFLAEENPSGQTKIFLNKRERGVGRLDLYDDGTLEVSIRGFTAGLIWGVMIGTYSSFGLAVPLLSYLKIRPGGEDDKEEAEEAGATAPSA